YHKRTEMHFNLGTIDWGIYNVSNSQIIFRALDLAQTICGYLEQRSCLEMQSKLNQEELDKRELEWERDKIRLEKKITNRIQRISALQRREKCLKFLLK